MRYLIIGLGIYGTNLAVDLTDLGNEVIGADINPVKVEALKDYIATTYIVDSTEESALEVLPLKNVDLVIVAIGENFGASVKTVALLKKLRIPRIYARAIDDVHEAILEGMAVQRILTPEQRAAKDLVNEMHLGTSVDSLSVDGENYVLKFEAPEYYHGMLYSDLTLGKHGLRLVAASRRSPSSNILGITHRPHRVLDLNADPQLRVAPGDTLTCYGPVTAYRKLFKLIN